VNGIVNHYSSDYELGEGLDSGLASTLTSLSFLPFRIDFSFEKSMLFISSSFICDFGLA
jgi:hypothetical protein